MKIKRFNESSDEDVKYLKYFADIKSVYNEFKYHTSFVNDGVYTVDFSTRHNHRFSFEKFLEMQALINSKLVEMNKDYVIFGYELDVDNYFHSDETEGDIYHMVGRLSIKKR